MAARPPFATALAEAAPEGDAEAAAAEPAELADEAALPLADMERADDMALKS